jgi:predicted transglutaminase-like protease
MPLPSLRFFVAYERVKNYLDIAEIQLSRTCSCRSFQNRTTKHILKNERIAGNTVRKLEVHTSKEISQSKLYLLNVPAANSVSDISDQMSYHILCNG